MKQAQLTQPILTGAVAALVGFSSSFAVVLAGLRAVGATAAEATLGLTMLTLLQGAITVVLSGKFKMPLLIAWSTPGAAILMSVTGVAGGWPAAVGAFIVTALLIILTGLWPWLGSMIALIPAPLAQAMLAGVLLTICVQPVMALAEAPLAIAPVLVLWLLLMRFAPRFAAPAAFGLALVIVVYIIVTGGQGFEVTLPGLMPTMPEFNVSAVFGIAVPLYIVTMASQNVPGVAIMAAHGYRVPWRASLVSTGVGTLVAAPFGGHALNLAAITAAMIASSGAHTDVKKRWIAASAAGITYLVIGLMTPLLTAAVSYAPAGLIETVAGLALITTMVAALADAFSQKEQRIATGITFLVAASPVAIFGIGAAFWGLLLGLVIWLMFKVQR